jgi:hypothetical protein
MKTTIAHEIPPSTTKTILPKTGSFLMINKSLFNGLSSNIDFVIVLSWIDHDKLAGIYVSQNNHLNAAEFTQKQLEQDYVLLPKEFSINLTQD